jgi:hypothetical protein
MAASLPASLPEQRSAFLGAMITLGGLGIPASSSASHSLWESVSSATTTGMVSALSSSVARASDQA